MSKHEQFHQPTYLLPSSSSSNLHSQIECCGLTRRSSLPPNHSQHPPPDRATHYYPQLRRDSKVEKVSATAAKIFPAQPIRHLHTSAAYGFQYAKAALTSCSILAGELSSFLEANFAAISHQHALLLPFHPPGTPRTLYPAGFCSVTLVTASPER